MKYASLDIGTNTILLLIGDIDRDIQDILDISSITRLGEGLKEHGYLLDTAMGRTIEVLKGYRNIAKAHSVKDIYCVGTSALREAKNSLEFLEMVKRECGISVHVISGQQEAYYTYLSVKKDSVFKIDPLFIVDIGGGSSEIIIGDRKKMTDYVSMPIGTVKLTEMFIKHDPPLEDEINSMKSYIGTFLDKYFARAGHIFIGTGGTITNLASIMLGLEVFDKGRIHGFSFSLHELRDITAKLKGIDTSEREKMRGIEKGREDIITQGAILLEEIMSHYTLSDCVVSTKGVRYGVLYEHFF